MEHFIDKVVSNIIARNNNFLNVVCVLPSERAGVFLKESFKSQLKEGGFIMPQIVSIENFIKELSGIEALDNTALLFTFYEIYLSCLPKEIEPDSFLKFLGWAPIVLQDFNEIDRHLIPVDQLFEDLFGVERIKGWQIDESEVKKSKLISHHLNFVAMLPKFYHDLEKYLIKNGTAYQGLIYRNAAQNIRDFLQNNTEKSIYMIGFNALNKAEEIIFQEIMAYDQHDIFWDMNTTALQSNNDVGLFFRKYTKEWPCYQKRKPFWIEDFTNNIQKIEVIGSAINIATVKSIAVELEKRNQFNSTAIVMAEEQLLPLMINSLPKNVQQLNITMGYGLSNLPLHGLIVALFDLHLNYEKFNKQAFYYQDVLTFFKVLKHLDYFKELSNEIIETIECKNLIFIAPELLQTIFEKMNSSFSMVFKVENTIALWLKNLISFLQHLQLQVVKNEAIYIQGALAVFQKISNLNEGKFYVKNIITLQKLYQQLIEGESLDFKGQATQGLQLMGVLETRCLDFETLYITSVNEGVLPSTGKEKSMIPYDIKCQYQLPTNLHKDAIYAYHFYRLLQRAKNVKIYYNTQKDDFGAGEKSRYISQLEIFNGIQQTNVVSKLLQPEITKISIEKDADLMKILLDYAKKGFSPSSLNEYVRNPIDFYKKKILKLSDLEEVEEELAFNTLGTIVHDILEELYKPFLNKELRSNDFKDMFQRKATVTQNKVVAHFKGGDVSTGKNRLILEVIHTFVNRFLKYEEKLVAEGNKLVVLSLESAHHISLQTPKGHQVSLFGKIDRIDELNGVRRVVDYKTGKVLPGDLKVEGFEELNTDVSLGKVLQVMVYALMYLEVKSVDVESIKLQSGIYSFKNFSAGFMPVVYQKEAVISQSQIASFREELLLLIDEILEESINFEERV